MLISQSFTSKYLRAADLQGKEVRVKISHVALEDLGDEKKPVIYFVGKQKGLVLNKTNARTTAMRYGDDTDGWQEGDVILYPAYVDFRGEQKESIRVKVPPRRDSQAPLSEENPPPNMGEQLNDAIPF